MLALVAGIVASCTPAASRATTSTTTSSSTTSTTLPPSTSTSSTSTTTTTTTIPQSFQVAPTATFNVSEPDATTETPQCSTTPGRFFQVEVRYPVLAGDSQAHPGAPYPVIVFAHGFAVTPDTYVELLDAWVQAGFVVVAPIFPDENAYMVDKYGGPSSPAANCLEHDELNEPGDIPATLDELGALAKKGSHSPLSGLVDMKRIGLAGQSDGGNVMAALAFDSAQYKAQLAALPTRPRAVAILSGQAMPGTTVPYTASSASPPLLMVQSNADTCNLPGTATTLYGYLQADPTRWFVELLGAQHLPPYTGGDPSHFAVVAKVTTEFFELELGWRSQGLTASSVSAAGTSPNIAQVYTTTVPSIPNPQTVYC